MKKFITLLLLSVSLSVMAGEHCKATTKDKKPCSNWAEKGSGFCHFHNPANWCEANKKDGTRCHSIKAGGTKYCARHQK